MGKVNFTAAQVCIESAIKFRDEGAVEDVLRHSLVSHLTTVFPERPWWVQYHVRGTEHHLKFDKEGVSRGGFVDALVGLTVIEYEKDLRNAASFSHGLLQVKDYCAGLLNEGHDPSLIVGILSDTVEWHAYRISGVRPLDPNQIYGRDDIELDEIQVLKIRDPDERNARLLGDFLERHLGREEARPLSAQTLVHDLGFDSVFCERHIREIRDLVVSAFRVNAGYAKLIQKLWADFVAYLGDSASAGKFDEDVYIRELYLLTLAKLICANVIAKQALVSDEAELQSILDGGYFKTKGLLNLVEYDYFGWLNEPPHVDSLVPVAVAIQSDLRAYNFHAMPAEDLFGAMLAQLATRSQRLLLGQEWTPAWLAGELVKKVFDQIPPHQPPRLIDMCCGSGAMVVEAVKQARRRLDASGTPHDAAYVSLLAHSITGFDIDPLAVMLAKVGWVVAARDCLEPLGAFEVSIPIYHADSLFTATPLSQKVDEETGANHYDLVLDEEKVGLPGFLISPDSRALFDALLNACYELAMTCADTGELPRNDDWPALVTQAEDNAGITIENENREGTSVFCRDLVTALSALQQNGRNGIWAFVLRNSYRPGLVAGLFNGVVSNPPWLALSKVAENPYKAALKQRAESYGIKPPGSSHLHIELATIFLLHAVDRYLENGAAVGCILPDTILNGHQHNPFRKGAFRTARRPIPLCVDELWKVESGTFKNEAIILFGQKNRREALTPKPIPGALLSKADRVPVSFTEIQQGNRVAWTHTSISGREPTGFFNPADFRQGADIMPRRLVFFEIKQVNRGKWQIASIKENESDLRYLVREGKTHAGFQLSPAMVPDRFVFDVLMSNHLTPFDIHQPAKAVLPIEKRPSGWGPVNINTLTLHSAAKRVFDRVFAAMGSGISIDQFYERLDSNRRKLTNQDLPTSGWLVFVGAGGGRACAGFVQAEARWKGKLIIDQTLYWTQVNSEDEALYLTGLLNSEAVHEVIKEFLPRGQRGGRHLHTLPIRATPPYMATDAAHVDVVLRTRALLSEWRSIKEEDAELRGLLDPNRALPMRRRAIRKALEQLPSYPAYEIACRSVYGV